MGRSSGAKLQNITPEELEKMVEDGRVVLAGVMRGQWEIRMGDEVIGSVNTDFLTHEQVVMIGERELGRFTDR